ncbi:MAG: hypothetical protein ABH842_01670 [Candidatus Micrarchaeota archaeon]
MKIPQSAITIGILLVVLVVSYMLLSSAPKGHYPNFASCLTEKGVKFYGAFWCTHCEEQKTLFGDSWSLINYTECSTPDGSGQTQVCKDAGIKSYPTWEFSDGSRRVGALPLEELSNKTGCAIDPQE